MKKERNFIVSDLHGNIEIYNAIMLYLENLQNEHQDEEVILYMNGDIIDRGTHSMEMLLDMIDRSKGRVGNITVKMLAGNHEWLMKEALDDWKKNHEWPKDCNWFLGTNGGQKSAEEFDKLSCERKGEIIDFIDNLPLWHRFYHKMKSSSGIILVHAYPPRDILLRNTIPTLSTDSENLAKKCLWLRRDELGKAPIGIEKELTIIGHDPVESPNGYEYTKKDNVLCIDAGCAYYALGDLDGVMVPLVELDFQKEQIQIHTFNEKGIYQKTTDLTDLVSSKISEESSKIHLMIENITTTYQRVRIEEKQEPFVKRHKEVRKKLESREKPNTIAQSILYHIGSGYAHFKEEMIHQLKKLKPISDDDLMRWMIRNRKTFATVALFGAFNGVENKNTSNSHLESVEIDKIYKIENGDTLSEIALNNLVTVEEIKEENNLTSDTIYVGDELSIPYKFEFKKDNLDVEDITDSISYDGLPLEYYAELYSTSIDTLEALNPNYKDCEFLFVPNFEEVETEVKKRIKK